MSEHEVNKYERSVIEQMKQIEPTEQIMKQIMKQQKNPYEQQENTTQTKPVPPQENSHEHQK